MEKSSRFREIMVVGKANGYTDTKKKPSPVTTVKSPLKREPDESEWDVFGGVLYALPEVLPPDSSNPVAEVYPTSKVDEEKKIKALVETYSPDWNWLMHTRMYCKKMNKLSRKLLWTSRSVFRLKLGAGFFDSTNRFASADSSSWCHYLSGVKKPAMHSCTIKRVRSCGSRRFKITSVDLPSSRKPSSKRCKYIKTNVFPGVNNEHGIYPRRGREKIICLQVRALTSTLPHMMVDIILQAVKRAMQNSYY